MLTNRETETMLAPFADTAPTPADPRWAAVLARDPAADGRFFTAVLSTGIYCRPTCPARHPKPENVRFYPTAAAAERAGFRACKRCRPDQDEPAAVTRALVAEACRRIEAADAVPTLAALARGAHLSPHHFHRVFKAVTGVTPKGYADAQRAGRMQDALAERRSSVTTAIHDAGYTANGRFYAAADAALGMSPTQYRSGGVGTTIRYAAAACSLGAVLVAASPKGVCAILLGDDPAQLARDLAERFPRAERIGDDPGFAATVASVVALVEAPETGLDLPLDIAGTAFQRRVWEALRAIPAGTTASYTAIAAAIGEPNAARAVAQACAANPVAIAVPCHRVVRSDGGLSGYRWGTRRKAALLARERAARERAAGDRAVAPD